MSTLNASELVTHVHEFLHKEIKCKFIPRTALKKGSILLAKWEDTIAVVDHSTHNGTYNVRVIVKLTPNERFWISLNGKVRMVQTQEEVEEILRMTTARGLKKYLDDLRVAGEELACMLRENGAKNTKSFQIHRGSEHVFAALDLGQCKVDIGSMEHNNIFGDKTVTVKVDHILDRCHPRDFQKTLRKTLRSTST